MLILNNGVPKSGSTMVQDLIRKAVKPARPSEKWQNPDWSNASVVPDKIAPFMESDEFKAADYVLLKMHFEMSPDFDFLRGHPDVNVIVSWRNVPDSVLSFFHHQIRRGRTQLEDKLTWLNTRGRRFARQAIAHKKSWRDVSNCHFVQFEELLARPDAEFAAILAFLGVELSEEDRGRILDGTIVQLKDGEKPREGAHVRTAGQSRAKKELPDTFYAEFDAMNAEIFEIS